MQQPVIRPQQQRNREAREPLPHAKIGYKGKGKLSVIRGGVPVRSQAEILQLAGRRV